MSSIDTVYNMHQTTAECFQNFEDWSSSDRVWLFLIFVFWQTALPIVGDTGAALTVFLPLRLIIIAAFHK